MICLAVAVAVAVAVGSSGAVATLATTTDDGAAHITVVPTADGAAVTVSPPAIGAAAAHPTEVRGPATSLAANYGDRMDAWLLARQLARRDRATRSRPAFNLTAYHLSPEYIAWKRRGPGPCPPNAAGGEGEGRGRCGGSIVRRLPRLA